MQVMPIYGGSSVEVCSVWCSHSQLNSAPPVWCQNYTKSPMSPTHKKCKWEKITTGIPACNMPRNMTANKKVNVYSYYTHYKKIKFINVDTVPFCLYHAFLKNQTYKGNMFHCSQHVV